VVLAAAAAGQAAWRLLGLRGAPPVLTADVKAFGFRFRLSNAKIRALGWMPRIAVDAGMEEAFAYFAAHRDRLV